MLSRFPRKEPHVQSSLWSQVLFGSTSNYGSICKVCSLPNCLGRKDGDLVYACTYLAFVFTVLW